VKHTSYPQTSYPNQSISWFSSILPGKCQNSFLKEALTLYFHTSNHSSIIRISSLITEFRVKSTVVVIHNCQYIKKYKIKSKQIKNQKIK